MKDSNRLEMHTDHKDSHDYNSIKINRRKWHEPMRQPAFVGAENTTSLVVDSAIIADCRVSNSGHVILDRQFKKMRWPKCGSRTAPRGNRGTERLNSLPSVSQEVSGTVLSAKPLTQM